MYVVVDRNIRKGLVTIMDTADKVAETYTIDEAKKIEKDYNLKIVGINNLKDGLYSCLSLDKSVSTSWKLKVRHKKPTVLKFNLISIYGILNLSISYDNYTVLDITRPYKKRATRTRAESDTDSIFCYFYKEGLQTLKGFQAVLAGIQIYQALEFKNLDRFRYYQLDGTVLNNVGRYAQIPSSEEVLLLYMKSLYNYKVNNANSLATLKLDYYDLLPPVNCTILQYKDKVIFTDGDIIISIPVDYIITTASVTKNKAFIARQNISGNIGYKFDSAYNAVLLQGDLKNVILNENLNYVFRGDCTFNSLKVTKDNYKLTKGCNIWVENLYCTSNKFIKYFFKNCEPSIKSVEKLEIPNMPKLIEFLLSKGFKGKLNLLNVTTQEEAENIYRDVLGNEISDVLNEAQSFNVESIIKVTLIRKSNIYELVRDIYKGVIDSILDYKLYDRYRYDLMEDSINEIADDDLINELNSIEGAYSGMRTGFNAFMRTHLHKCDLCTRMYYMPEYFTSKIKEALNELEDYYYNMKQMALSLNGSIVAYYNYDTDIAFKVPINTLVAYYPEGVVQVDDNLLDTEVIFASKEAYDLFLRDLTLASRFKKNIQDKLSADLVLKLVGSSNKYGIIEYRNLEYKVDKIYNNVFTLIFLGRNTFKECFDFNKIGDIGDLYNWYNCTADNYSCLSVRNYSGDKAIGLYGNFDYWVVENMLNSLVGKNREKAEIDKDRVVLDLRNCNLADVDSTFRFNPRNVDRKIIVYITEQQLIGSLATILDKKSRDITVKVTRG